MELKIEKIQIKRIKSSTVIVEACYRDLAIKSFHVSVECWQIYFSNFSKKQYSCFHFHIWIQHEKCIQKSTNKTIVFQIASIILRKRLTFYMQLRAWRKIIKGRSCTISSDEILSFVFILIPTQISILILSLTGKKCFKLACYITQFMQAISFASTVIYHKTGNCWSNYQLKMLPFVI